MALRQRSELCPARREADPGRRQLAGAGDARRSGSTSRSSCRSGQRLDDRGRRRKPLRRLGDVAGGRSSSATPTRRRSRRSRRPPQRGTTLRRADRGRGRAGRGDRRRRAVGRDGAARLVRDRGGDERDPARARLHAARPDHQVRRLLPRPRRTALLASAGSGLATLGIPSSPGVPDGRDRRHDVVTPYNDLDATAAAVERYGEGLAAIIVEPVAGNMGVVPPAPGFLEALRRALRRLRRAADLRRGDHRLPRRARRRAGALRRPARPDRSSARSSAAGCPLAAFGGRADVMEKLAPAGDVYQAGTLSGNPLATAAGISVLRRLRDAGRLRGAGAKGARLEAGLAPFGARPARRRDGDALPRRRGRSGTSRTRRRATPSATAPCSAHLLERGIYVAPSQFECLFVSLAHSDEDIDRTVEAVGDFFGRLTLGDDRRRGGGREPALGRAAARRARARARVFWPLAPDRFALGARDDLRGLPRPLRPAAALLARGRDVALLLGDYLYAHGLVRIAATGELDAVATLAELISTCAHLRAEQADGDGEAWVDAVRRLGGEPDAARSARARATHASRGWISSRRDRLVARRRCLRGEERHHRHARHRSRSSWP